MLRMQFTPQCQGCVCTHASACVCLSLRLSVSACVCSYFFVFVIKSPDKNNLKQDRFGSQFLRDQSLWGEYTEPDSSCHSGPSWLTKGSAGGLWLSPVSCVVLNPVKSAAITHGVPAFSLTLWSVLLSICLLVL